MALNGYTWLNQIPDLRVEQENCKSKLKGTYEDLKWQNLIEKEVIYHVQEGQLIKLDLKTLACQDK